MKIKDHIYTDRIGLAKQWGIVCLSRWQARRRHRVPRWLGHRRFCPFGQSLCDQTAWSWSSGRLRRAGTSRQSSAFHLFSSATQSEGNSDTSPTTRDVRAAWTRLSGSRSRISGGTRWSLPSMDTRGRGSADSTSVRRRRTPMQTRDRTRNGPHRRSRHSSTIARSLVVSLCGRTLCTDRCTRLVRPCRSRRSLRVCHHASNMVF